MIKDWNINNAKWTGGTERTFIYMYLFLLRLILYVEYLPPKPRLHFTKRPRRNTSRARENANTSSRNFFHSRQCVIKIKRKFAFCRVNWGFFSLHSFKTNHNLWLSRRKQTSLRETKFSPLAVSHCPKRDFRIPEINFQFHPRPSTMFNIAISIKPIVKPKDQKFFSMWSFLSNVRIIVNIEIVINILQYSTVQF